VDYKDRPVHLVALDTPTSQGFQLGPNTRLERDLLGKQYTTLQKGQPKNVTKQKTGRVREQHEKGRGKGDLPRGRTHMKTPSQGKETFPKPSGDTHGTQPEETEILKS